MKLLITLLITLFIIMLAENSIRKHSSIWYFSTFILSLLCLLLPSSVPGWLTYFSNNIIGRGTLATAIFILVMYARVFPPRSRLFRTLMSLRAPLAIMAAFMILLHNGTYFPIILGLSFSLAFIPFSKTPDAPNQIITIRDDSVALTESETITASEEPISPEYQDGEWIGTALGYNDDITVSVTISSGKITDISIIESSDDEPYYDWAKEEIPQRIIGAQSTDIDTVSGATFSSEGIINAVSDALQKAQL